MARWLRNVVDSPEDSPTVHQAVYRPRQSLQAAIGFDEAGPMTGLGLGWVEIAADGIRPTFVVKTGRGAGFLSYAAFARAAISACSSSSIGLTCLRSRC
jgi:D-alanyl-D-alanine-carboxypeptidase/D-alanyl-D-alanine-endopeptidase